MEIRKESKLGAKIKEKATQYAFKKINHWLEKEKDEEVTLRKLIKLARKLGKFHKGIDKATDNFEKIFLGHPQGIPLAQRIKENMAPECRQKFFTNFLFRASLARPEGYYNYLEKYKVAPPYTILISPLMRCNLHCVGCYAANYSRKDDLPFDVVNRVIDEGESIGTAFYTILGGEPFFWEHLFEMFEMHPNVYFQVYTNGTLITEEVAEKLKKAGNVAVMVSLEGFKKLTDERRGEGVFDKVMGAMDILRKHRIPFGYSVCATNKNYKEILSDEFINLMIEKGALIGWYFLYMPVGQNPSVDLMPTPQQRLYMKDRHEEIRATRPIFLIDFWNDAPYVGGCIAGGRHFVHINNYGDVEPCIFLHLATDNIKEKSLAEALNSPYFRDMRSRQPFDKNLYLPCQIIDHPKIFKDLYEKHHPYPACPDAEKVVTELHPALLKYSEELNKVYEEPWRKEINKIPWDTPFYEHYRKKYGDPRKNDGKE